MRMLKRISIGIVILFVVACLVGPYFFGQWLLTKVPQEIKNTERYGFLVQYQDLRSPFCLLCVKLTSDQTLITTFVDQVELGKVSVEIPLWNLTKIYFKTQPIKKEKSLALNGYYQKGQAQILNANLILDKLNTTLSGYVNIKDKSVFLKGQAYNLLDFIKKYVPEEVQPFLTFILKNDAQSIEIDTYKTYLRLNKIPFMKLD